MSGLKRGTEIRCKACQKVILIAAVDIPPKAQMKSEYLTYADGTPVEHGAKMNCPHCWIRYASISTETAETILGFDFGCFPASSK